LTLYFEPGLLAISPVDSSGTEPARDAHRKRFSERSAVDGSHETVRIWPDRHLCDSDRAGFL